MNEERMPLDREVKVMLLQVLRKGFFSPDDFKLLSEKAGYDPITVEIIDSRNQVTDKEI